MKRTITMFAMLCITYMVLAKGDVDTRIPISTQTYANTFVVIISNEDYRYEEKVPYALNDGKIFQLYCEKTLGIPSKNIVFAQNASLGDMRYHTAWLEKVMRAYNGQAKAIYYYSGHGMPAEDSRQAYLLPVDGYSSSPLSAMSTEELYKQLGNMPSKGTLVILDACFSGAKRGEGMLSSSRGVAIVPRTAPMQGNMVAFSAATSNETAYPYKEAEHGMFTYFILERLQDKGGCTTLGELSDYVRQQVQRTSIVENKKSQTPTIVAATGCTDWRNWRFADRPASKYFTVTTPTPSRSIPQETPLKKQPQVIPQRTQPQTIPQKTQPQGTLSDNSNTLQLAEMGKKSMRSLNYGQAYSYLKQAVDQNSLQGNYLMGVLYNDNNYENYSKAQAELYYTKAAQAGHVEACYRLGLLFVGTDNAKARMYMQKAASAGHQGARSYLNKL